MNRRDFLLRASSAAGGTAAAATAATPAGAQETTSPGGAGTSSPSGTTGTTSGTASGGNQSANGSTGNASGNASGNGSQNASAGGGGGGGTETVEVGAGSGLSFAPAELTIAPGTTVVWEWTGEGGAHNVVSDEGGPLDSGSPESGSDITYEYTFEETGEFPYHCVPHEGQGMVGTITVQQGGASSGGGGGEEEVTPEEMGVPIQAHWVGVATILMLVVTFVYTFFQLKYGESPNAKGGN